MLWSEGEFLAHVDNPELHRRLLRSVRAIIGLSLDFMEKSKRSKLAGYKVFYEGARVLWIMEPSKATTFYPSDIYVDWQTLPRERSAVWIGLWQLDVINPDNFAGSFAIGGLASIGIEGVVSRLEKLIAMA